MDLRLICLICVQMQILCNGAYITHQRDYMQFEFNLMIKTVAQNAKITGVMA